MRNLTKLLVVLAAIFCLAAASPAFADSYNWTYTASGLYYDTGGSGSLTATPTGTPGVDLVTGISGTWDTFAITGLLPLTTCCSTPANDNLLYLSGAPFDLGGLGFSISPADPYGNWVNIYDPGTEWVLTGSSGNEGGTVTDEDGTFAITPTPEPMTLGLLGCGLVGLFLAKKRT